MRTGAHAVGAGVGNEGLIWFTPATLPLAEYDLEVLHEHVHGDDHR
jgi:hypothetical protein